MKHCGCGRGYDAEAWSRLPRVGYQVIPAGAGGPAMHLELRDCPCGSTLAVDLLDAATLPGPAPGVYPLPHGEAT